jgi:hypothetical protein
MADRGGKNAARSLARANRFPADFIPTDRDGFACRQRPVRIRGRGLATGCAAGNAAEPNSVCCQRRCFHTSSKSSAARAVLRLLPHAPSGLRGIAKAPVDSEFVKAGAVDRRSVLRRPADAAAMPKGRPVYSRDWSRRPRRRYMNLRTVYLVYAHAHAVLRQAGVDRQVGSGVNRCLASPNLVPGGNWSWPCYRVCGWERRGAYLAGLSVLWKGWGQKVMFN